MCLIALAWKNHPRYPLILVANRDEFYRRPTAPAQFWEDNSQILGGRDLQAGGTWLAVRRDGRWSAVTNYREGSQGNAPRSRGELTRGFLQNRDPLHDYAARVQAEGDGFGGFNLLLGEERDLLYCSNRQPRPLVVQPGVHTLSNHLLDTPWPKAVHAREALQGLLEEPSVEPEALLSALQRDTPFEDELLPDTGVGVEMERLLSPPFIRSENYGTRCTTVLMKSREGDITLLEQNYLPGGAKGELRRFYLNPNSQ